MDENWDEKLRELCSLGDLASIQHVIDSQQVDVNSQNKMNGWSALHWASKRNHLPVVKYLVEICKANPSIKTFKGETPIDLCTHDEIKKYFSSISSAESNISTSDSNNLIEMKVPTLGFVPNYLTHPSFIYAQSPIHEMKEKHVADILQNEHKYYITSHSDAAGELILKIRNASSDELDFIEVELSRRKLTMNDLLSLCCEELQINAESIKKVRKLPNTILRKDKDVERLKDFQELEFILI